MLKGKIELAHQSASNALEKIEEIKLQCNNSNIADQIKAQISQALEMIWSGCQHIKRLWTIQDDTRRQLTDYHISLKKIRSHVSNNSTSL